MTALIAGVRMEATLQDLRQHQAGHGIRFLTVLTRLEDYLADGLDELSERRIDSVFVRQTLHDRSAFPPAVAPFERRGLKKSFPPRSSTFPLISMS